MWCEKMKKSDDLQLLWALWEWLLTWLYQSHNSSLSTCLWGCKPLFLLNSYIIFQLQTATHIPLLLDSERFPQIWGLLFFWGRFSKGGFILCRFFNFGWWQCELPFHYSFSVKRVKQVLVIDCQTLLYSLTCVNSYMVWNLKRSSNPPSWSSGLGQKFLTFRREHRFSSSSLGEVLMDPSGRFLKQIRSHLSSHIEYFSLHKCSKPTWNPIWWREETRASPT